VILQGLQPEKAETFRLYSESNYEKDKRLCAAIEKISRRFGREAVRFGFQKSEKNWKMNCNYKSNRYTTSLKEVLHIKQLSA
jgi:DNA polymerase V